MLSGAGCGGGSRAEYDPVNDRSTIIGPRHEVSWLELPGCRQTFKIYLGGKGKRPQEWSASLFYEVERPASSKDAVGEDPKIEHKTVPGIYTAIKSSHTFGDEIDDTFIFYMSLQDLINFTDYNGYTLNGKTIQLTKEQRESIQQTVAAARAVTNGD
jgi:hypothetical protein